MTDKSLHDMNNVFDGKISDLNLQSNNDIVMNGGITYAEPPPKEGEVRYHQDKGVMQIYTEAGDGWRDMAMPVSENNGYDEVITFIEKLSVQQLQDIYKQKNNLLVKIEKLLLGQI